MSLSVVFPWRKEYGSLLHITHAGETLLMEVVSGWDTNELEVRLVSRGTAVRYTIRSRVKFAWQNLLERISSLRG